MPNPVQAARHEVAPPPFPPRVAAWHAPFALRQGAGRARSGFTLLELMIALGIVAMFLFWVYQLFIGGSKTANKANWISTIVDQLRNGTSFLSQNIKSTSYPTTLLADTIKDPCENPDKSVAQEYFLKIKSNGTDIKAPTAGQEEIMRFSVCQPEKPSTTPPQAGQVTVFKLMFHAVPNSLVTVGDLRMEVESFSFTTTPPQYAQGGKVSLTPIAGSKKTVSICTDVEHVSFQVDPGASLPTDPTDFRFMQIKIHCVYPKDPKTYKDNSIMITPNVGIMLL
ncbi:MAG: prepilin-type N-terminal cleavage/methylation domain-containing protein [Candidatus Riflebacteria bacterium]|nr:prepilin-type N-terminal cleavage/methylation domain-containing protein [Candidatus Riflebacteria bacterium]